MGFFYRIFAFFADIYAQILDVSGRYVYVTACCSVLQRVAACCSVLQRVAACCSVCERVCLSGRYVYVTHKNLYMSLPKKLA